MPLTPTRTDPPRAARDPIGSPRGSLDDFVRRLSEQVAVADEQVRALRAEAHDTFISREKRVKQFVEVADLHYERLLSRLSAFRSVSVFADVIQHNSPEPGVSAEKERHHWTASLTFPSSDKRPKTMELSFRIGHDGPVERIVIDYQLTLLPIFFAFEAHDQLSGLPEELDADTVSEWFEAKLLGFTQTYFAVFFHEQYQRDSLVTDPVLRIRFPRSMAVARHDSAGSAYYFYTDDSVERFQADPELYI
ncbi:MAG: hypothetical protein ACYTGL_28670 [Planctomycetota bacterium]